MRTRLMRTSLLTPILLALLFIAAGSAFGQAPDPTRFYQIMARHSRRCLDVTGGSGGNGVPVIQWDCHGGENQQWKFTPVGAGYYKITARHSGKALEVFGGVFLTSNGGVVGQWEYVGNTNQMWYVGDLGSGIYQIITRHSNKSLDIRGASTENGATAQQYDYGSGNNQLWMLTLIP
jgi:hypothetical protein